MCQSWSMTCSSFRLTTKNTSPSAKSYAVSQKLQMPTLWPFLTQNFQIVKLTKILRWSKSLGLKAIILKWIISWLKVRHMRKMPTLSMDTSTSSNQLLLKMALSYCRGRLDNCSHLQVLRDSLRLNVRSSFNTRHIDLQSNNKFNQMIHIYKIRLQKKYLA